MRYGYWMPVFGGWLRNVADENMEASWPYIKKLAQRSEEIGFDVTLLAELHLNDIKGPEAPSLDAWSTAAALAAVTQSLELMVAVRPTFHLPALLAKQAANIDNISNGRVSLNVVSSWWAEEARKYGVQFDEHDDRYARTAEWLDIVDAAWKKDHFSHTGKYYSVQDLVLQPKPVSKPRPVIYAGGESETAKNLIAEKCDAYVMHGDPPERIAEKIADMRVRREKKNLPPMKFGVAGYVVVRESEAEAKKEVERRVSLEEYSVSNRGLRSGLVGTPQRIADQIGAFEKAGADLLLLQFSPQLEEMDRFSSSVIKPRSTSKSTTAH